MTRLSTCWALPPKTDPNAVANALARGMHLRWPFVVPENYLFDPDATSVLAEGWTHDEMADAVLEYGAEGIIANVHVHDPGSTTGTGYHNAGGHTRPPRLDPDGITSYCRDLFAYLEAEGVPLFAAQLGNELDYHPEHTGDWDDYLAACWTATQRMIAQVPTGLLIIGGGHKASSGQQIQDQPETRILRRSERILDGGEPKTAEAIFDNAMEAVANRTTIAEHFLSKGLSDADLHGNGDSIAEVNFNIDTLRGMGANVWILEDRHEGPNNDALERAKAFSTRGALCVSQFLSRNVNFAGDNPNCLWGVQTHSKKNRSTGAPWTCAGHVEIEWELLTQAAEWLGTMQRPASEDLPMNGEEPPMPPEPKAPGEDKFIAIVKRWEKAARDEYGDVINQGPTRDMYKAWYERTFGAPEEAPDE